MRRPLPGSSVPQAPSPTRGRGFAQLVGLDVRSGKIGDGQRGIVTHLQTRRLGKRGEHAERVARLGGDLPWLHEREPGVGGDVDAAVAQGGFDLGVDIAQRLVVAARPADGIYAQRVAELGQDGAGIATPAQKRHPAARQIGG